MFTTIHATVQTIKLALFQGYQLYVAAETGGLDNGLEGLNNGEVTKPFSNIINLILSLFRWVAAPAFIVLFVLMLMKFKDQDSHNAYQYMLGCFVCILLLSLESIAKAIGFTW